MRPLKVAVGSAALMLVAAVNVLPVEVAGAQAPSTTVLIPADNSATVSGTSQVLDATASAGVIQVQYEITGGTLSDSVVASGTATIYGWLAQWNTTNVANGVYSLQSVATDASDNTDTSTSVNITVDNPTPSTTVLVPANQASVSGISSVLDASASPSYATVTYELSGGMLNGDVIATGTLTYYGWLAEWNTTTVPNGNYSLVSMAAYPNGESTSSAPVSISVDNPSPSTSVVLPASGATLDGTQTQYFDAVASPGVTEVTINLNLSGGGSPITLSTTPTIWGWIGVLPGTPAPPPKSDSCGPLTFSYSVQSVASYPSGLSGTSTSVPIAIDNLWLVGAGC